MQKGDKMKISVLQYGPSGSISENYAKIRSYVERAASEGARLFVTQECALCGYPPIEIVSVDMIDFAGIDFYLKEFQKLSQQLGIYIALGVIRRENGKRYNSMAFISPVDENIRYYDKRALWGWDSDNYAPGDENKGVFTVDGVKIGFRICFEIRFPEYFRELYLENVDVALVGFCDVADEDDPVRYEIIKSHLITRAVENIFYVVSSNSISKKQTAPKCVVNPDG
ncbi:MAG: carbon-nitrogen hydrolase family protein, partial [Candidatus Moranbacteria bacterium]|nr:carbon-nitrogen hydrolase family protein [Candidatus Moranbacteria bacterium]